LPEFDATTATNNMSDTAKDINVLLSDDHLNALMDIVEQYCPKLLSRAELAEEPMQQWIGRIRAWLRTSAVGPFLFSAAIELAEELMPMVSKDFLKQMVKDPSQLNGVMTKTMDQLAAKQAVAGISDDTLKGCVGELMAMLEQFPYMSRAKQVLKDFGVMEMLRKFMGSQQHGGNNNNGLESVMNQRNAQQMKERMQKLAAKKAEAAEAERLRQLGLMQHQPLMSEQELLDLFADEPITAKKQTKQQPSKQQQKRNR
jgi:hypothetical protein